MLGAAVQLPHNGMGWQFNCHLQGTDIGINFVGVLPTPGERLRTRFFCSRRYVMYRKSFSMAVFCVVAAVLSVVYVSSVAEATVLFSGNADAGAPTEGNYAQYTFGNQFVVGSKDIVVTSVAYADLSNGGGLGDGLVDSHQMAIWRTSDSVLLGSATVPSGTSATLTNGFRYVTLGTPITLLANTSYILGGDTAGTTPTANDTYKYSDVAPWNYTTTIGDGITITGRIQTAVGAAGFACPGGTISTGCIWESMNMAYSVVPEPGTLVLLATGLIGLLCYAWRKRK